MAKTLKGYLRKLQNLQGKVRVYSFDIAVYDFDKMLFSVYIRIKEDGESHIFNFNPNSQYRDYTGDNEKAYNDILDLLKPVTRKF